MHLECISDAFEMDSECILNGLHMGNLLEFNRNRLEFLYLNNLLMGCTGNQGKYGLNYNYKRFGRGS